MNSRLDIYRNGVRVETIIPHESSSVRHEHKAVRTLRLEWVSTERTKVRRGDYATVLGETFHFFDAPDEEMTSTMEYRYSATLHGEEKLLENTLCLFLDEIDGLIVSSTTDYSLNATPREIMSLICRNINRYTTSSTQWTYEVTNLATDGEFFMLDISGDSCKDVLAMLCNDANAEWAFNADTRCITLSDSDSIMRKTNIELLYPVNIISPFQLKRSGDVVTRLYVYGGDRNIPTDYRDGESNRLLMRGGQKYLSDGNGLPNERVYRNDDIYPHRKSGIRAVRMSEKGFFFVTDDTIDFDINKHLMDGVTAKISFLSGRLAGYQFEIARYDHPTRTIEIKQQTEQEYVIPNETMRPQVGDEYVLLDIIMPDTYITNAEEELYEDAMRYFRKECRVKVRANIKLSNVWLNKHDVRFRLHDEVRVKCIDEWRNIRITEIEEYPYNQSTFGRSTDIVVAEYEDEGTIKKIRERITSVSERLELRNRLLSGAANTLITQSNQFMDSLSWNH